MKNLLFGLMLFVLSASAFAVPPKLNPQNCNSCDKIRIFYCQGETGPASLNDVVEMNSAFIAGNSLVWFDDNAGTQGGLFNGTGQEPGVPSLGSPSSSFYWVAQSDGSTGPAIRTKIRVRKAPNISISFPVGTFCPGAAFDIASGVSDSRKVADLYLFYNTGNYLGEVEATKGVPDSYLIEAPSPGLNNYLVIGINEGFHACSDTVESTFTLPNLVELDSIPNDTFQSGQLVDLTFSSPNPETSNIIWVDHSSFNNPDIGIGGTIGSGSMLFFASNNTGVPLTAKIRVIPYAGNCAGTLQDFFITVNPSAQRLAKVTSGVEVFPNPAGAEIYYNTPFTVREFSVSNMRGNITFQGKDNNQRVDLSSLPPGVYVLRLQGVEGEYSIKHFIKL